MDRETQCTAKRNKWHIIRRQGFTERSAHTPPTQWSLLRSAGHAFGTIMHGFACACSRLLICTPLHHMGVSGSIRARDSDASRRSIESANEIVYGPGYEEAHLSTRWIWLACWLVDDKEKPISNLSLYSRVWFGLGLKLDPSMSFLRWLVELPAADKQMTRRTASVSQPGHGSCWNMAPIQIKEPRLWWGNGEGIISR